VIHLHFSAEDLGRIRFAFSPVTEAVASVRALSANSSTRLHAPWLREAAARLDGVDMGLLTTVVRPAGYLPDFLFPSPSRRLSSFDAGLAEMAATAPEVVAEQLSHLADHPVAQRGPGRRRREQLMRELVAAPEAALARILTELERYWQVAVAPYWPRIGALLQADLSYRLDELAAGGVQQLFRTLHPLVSFDRDTLRIVKYYEGHAELRRRGLLLVPCVFAWPDVLVRTADPGASTVTYSPRGLGRLWDTPTTPHGSPLADVLGRSRAAILAQLDLPMSTTQLACHLDLTAPTLNVHLKALRAAGIVSARRDGRSVLYQRTPLGDSLLTGSPER
jgi:DNA-binding transcriptional ArsR family regulator